MSSYPPDVPSRAQPEAGERAIEIFTALAAGDWESARADFDATMAAALPAQELAGDCVADGVSGPTRRAEVRRDGHCE